MIVLAQALLQIAIVFAVIGIVNSIRVRRFYKRELKELQERYQ